MSTIKRREFLNTVGLAAGAASVLRGEAVRAEWRAGAGEIAAPSGLRLGMASYTFRAFSLDETMAMTRRLGLRRLSVKSVHLPLESSIGEIRAAAAKIRAAGLEPYAGGVISMAKEPEIEQAFVYAAAAGMEMIIGVPDPELLPLVEKKVRQYDLRLAIHNHGPTDKVYPSPLSAYDRIKNLDRRIGLCLDVGHTQRCGMDPAEAAERCFDRLLDVHVKDVNAATAKGETLEAGRGVVDLPKFLAALRRLKYAGTASLEYEKDEKDPLPGAAESIGYIRGVLAAGGGR
ncbi:MAG: sugar phosphate isomerase/epimerase [Candidatus Aminicenantales bacterium]|jgi:sugar phosphate isomerase/epimerase